MPLQLPAWVHWILAASHAFVRGILMLVIPLLIVLSSFTATLLLGGDPLRECLLDEDCFLKVASSVRWAISIPCIIFIVLQRIPMVMVVEAWVLALPGKLWTKLTGLPTYGLSIIAILLYYIHAGLWELENPAYVVEYELHQSYVNKIQQEYGAERTFGYDIDFEKGDPYGTQQLKRALEEQEQDNAFFRKAYVLMLGYCVSGDLDSCDYLEKVLKEADASVVAAVAQAYETYQQNGNVADIFDGVH